jgi:putative FmdB family regulatory protein
MPLYEYECLECGAVFEKLVRKAADTAELKCPECGSVRLEDKISGFASVSRGDSSSSTACAPGGG